MSIRCGSFSTKKNALSPPLSEERLVRPPQRRGTHEILGRNRLAHLNEQECGGGGAQNERLVSLKAAAHD